MKLNTFTLPKAIYIKEVLDRKSRFKFARIGKRSLLLTSKQRRARPKLSFHKNCNDSNCKICTAYINKLQAWRNKHD